MPAPAMSTSAALVRIRGAAGVRAIMCLPAHVADRPEGFGPSRPDVDGSQKSLDHSTMPSITVSHAGAPHLEAGDFDALWRHGGYPEPFLSGGRASAATVHHRRPLYVSSSSRRNAVLKGAATRGHVLAVRGLGPAGPSRPRPAHGAKPGQVPGLREERVGGRPILRLARRGRGAGGAHAERGRAVVRDGLYKRRRDGKSDRLDIPGAVYPLAPV